jgi:hypothetical protein
MLTMLDAIQESYVSSTDKYKKDYYEKLVSKNVITFLFLNLTDFKRSDDLYIKMNARGVPLTDFENFKAKFEQYMKGDPSLSAIADEFSNKIDKEWTSLFWNVMLKKNDKKKAPDIDPKMMNFIRFIITNDYAGVEQLPEGQKTNDSLEYLVGTVSARGKDDYNNYISFYNYNEKLRVLRLEAVEYLKSALDIITNISDAKNVRLDEYLGKNSYFNEQEAFESAYTYERLTYPLRIRYHAYFCFIRRFGAENKAALTEWMRVVFNLTENQDYDTSELFAASIKVINSIIVEMGKSDCINILEHLVTVNDESKITSFLQRQIEEEIIKAHLLTRKEKEWDKALKDIETSPFFLGQILFILEFAGIVEYFEKNRNCSWSDTENSKFFSQFQDYSKKALAAFTLIDKSSENNYIWSRAVLTKGDYLINESSNRNNLLNSNGVPYYTWKRLMRLPPISDQNYKILTQKRLLVKEVFDDEIFRAENPMETLQKMIDNADVSDWRGHFISTPGLFSYCKHGFIHKNGEEMLLFNASQMNHLSIELNTYLFFLKYRDKNFKCFSHMEANSTKKGSERSYAYIKRSTDGLRIWVWYKGGKFEVGFNNDSKNSKIEGVLRKNKMNAIDLEEYCENAFMRSFSTDEETIKFMETLANEL